MQLKLNPQVCSSRRLLSSALRAYAMHLQPETPFPSESSLRREFGISRMTLNRALNDLVEEGILYSRRGAGRFVAAQDTLRVYFVLPFLEKRRNELADGSIIKDVFEEVQNLAKERNISLTPLIASLTNRRNELDLEVFSRLPDGANVILPGYWYSGLFDLLQAKKCKIVFISMSASFDFLYKEQVSSWYRMEYDLTASVELAMEHLRRCGVKRAVLIDDDNHSLSPYQIGLKRALKDDFIPELVIYASSDNSFGENTFACMLKSRHVYPFEGIIAATPQAALKVQEILKRQKIEMPTVVLKRGKIDDGTSFITYPNKSVADQALKQLISEKYVSGIKIIKPLFNEAGSTRKFLIKP